MVHQLSSASEDMGCDPMGRALIRVWQTSSGFFELRWLHSKSRRRASEAQFSRSLFPPFSCASGQIWIFNLVNKHDCKQTTHLIRLIKWHYSLENNIGRRSDHLSRFQPRQNRRLSMNWRQETWFLVSKHFIKSCSATSREITDIDNNSAHSTAFILASSYLLYRAYINYDWL